MMTQTTSTKIIETCQVSPPPGSVPPMSLPLTFFDIPYLFHRNPIQRLFFFDLPITTHHFTLTVLPKLKHSLSLALRHFFPLAADLVRPAPPHKPHLLFSEVSSVSFTVAESTACFDHLVSDAPRDVTDCHPLLPKLRPASPASPLLAIQVTVFPSSGFAVGFTLNHVAADGRAFNHFVKSWAFFCRTISSSQQSPPVELESPPSHGRDDILDPHGLVPTFLEAWWASTSGSNDDLGRRLENKVRATFVIGPAQIDKLKQWVSAQSGEPLTWHLSLFAAAVAFTWVQLIKSQLQTGAQVFDTYRLGIPADCRSRGGSDYPIPDTYFGNCLAFCYVLVKRSELLVENGVFCAAKAIGERIKKFLQVPLRGSDEWISNRKKKPMSGNLVVVAASPNLRVYDTDFGWGRPRKSQVVHVDISGAISLSECKDGDGGIEIGLALHKDTMETFCASFQQGLKLF